MYWFSRTLFGPMNVLLPSWILLRPSGIPNLTLGGEPGSSNQDCIPHRAVAETEHGINEETLPHPLERPQWDYNFMIDLKVCGLEKNLENFDFFCSLEFRYDCSEKWRSGSLSWSSASWDWSFSSFFFLQETGSARTLYCLFLLSRAGRQDRKEPFIVS